eukprot:m.11917 g.11917  ORF g.11917 m.11917 type:complete len:976 (+) comp2890_c0_seq1:248-3175(+)
MGKRRSSVESSQYEADADDSELLSSPDTFRARGAVGALMFDGGGERGDNDMYEDEELLDLDDDALLGGASSGGASGKGHRAGRGTAGTYTRATFPFSLVWRLVVMVTTAIVACGVALSGLQKWDESPAMTTGDTASPYTKLQFAGLIGFVLCMPMGILLGVIFLTQLFHFRRDPWASSTSRMTIAVRFVLLLVYGAVIVLTLAGAARAYERGENILSCGVIFCIGKKTEASKEYDDGKAFRNVTGAALLIVALSMLVFEARLTLNIALEFIMALRYGQRMSINSVKGVGVMSSSGHFGRRRRRRPRFRRSVAGQRRACAVAWFLIACPFLIGLTMLLPPTFEDFTKANLQVHAGEIVPAAGEHGSPEGVDAPSGLITRNWVLTKGAVILKAWPDVFIFYGCLYTVAVVGALGRASETVRAVLHWRPLAIRGVSIGTIFLTGAMGLLLWLWVWYWGYTHIYNDDPNMFHRERWARTLGQTTSLFMSLLVLPVSRNSMWVVVFGTSWEATLWIHIMFGYLVLAFGLAHMAMWWSVFSWGGRCDPRVFYLNKNGPLPGCENIADACNATCRSGSCPLSCSSFPHDIIPQGPLYYPSNSVYDGYAHLPTADDFTIPLMTVMFLIVTGVCMGILAHHRVRRAVFELFWAAHWIAFPALFIAVLLHATSSWYYLLGGLALWAIDHYIRIRNSLKTVHVEAMVPHDRYTQMVVAQRVASVRGTPAVRPLRHTAGQFCFVNIPRLSPYEWHPFTIASAPHDPVSMFHVKVMGRHTWTQRLRQLAVKVAAGEEPMPVVNVDGPYGLPPDVSRYNGILLVAGGIGITPMLSLFRHLQHQVLTGTCPCRDDAFKVRLVWLCRDVELFALAADAVADAVTDDRFTLSLHLTYGHRASWESLEGMTAGGPAAAVIEAIGEDEPDYDLEGHFENCIREGRPNLTHELEAVDPMGETTLVFACGPESLTARAAKVAAAAEAHFRSETFKL